MMLDALESIDVLIQRAVARARAAAFEEAATIAERYGRINRDAGGFAVAAALRVVKAATCPREEEEDR